eukprot:350173-Chlamydomonas_euryale.AAC.6
MRAGPSPQLPPHMRAPHPSLKAPNALLRASCRRDGRLSPPPSPFLPSSAVTKRQAARQTARRCPPKRARAPLRCCLPRLGARRASHCPHPGFKIRAAVKTDAALHPSRGSCARGQRRRAPERRRRAAAAAPKAPPPNETSALMRAVVAAPIAQLWCGSGKDDWL